VSMSLAEYHALDAIGNGRISDFIASPALYFGKYMVPKDDPRFIRDEQTGVTRIGSMLHCLVLEGAEELERRYRPWRGGLTKGRVLKDGSIAEGSRKPTRSKNSEAYEEFLADCQADRIEPCELQDLDHCETIATALYEHEDARELFLGDAPATNEETLEFEQLGMKCKARPDRRIHKPAVLVDLKSTGAMNLDEVQRYAIKCGYHRQAVWYSRAHEAVFGEAPRDFIFTTVRTSAPFLVWCWRITAAMEELANVEIDQALVGILGHRESGDWMPDECRRIQELPELKPWQMTRQARDEIQGAV
jgi:hypothetical protein